jgi:hypothetical protein
MPTAAPRSRAIHATSARTRSVPTLRSIADGWSCRSRANDGGTSGSVRIHVARRARVGDESESDRSSRSPFVPDRGRRGSRRFGRHCADIAVGPVAHRLRLQCRLGRVRRLSSGTDRRVQRESHVRAWQTGPVRGKLASRRSSFRCRNRRLRRLTFNFPENRYDLLPRRAHA